MSSPNDAKKLQRRLMRDIAGHDIAVGYVAVHTVIASVLEQVPELPARNQLAVRLIFSLLFDDIFDHIMCDEQRDFDAIATIQDWDARNIAVLGKIKALSDLTVPLAKFAEERGYLQFLRRRYKIDQRRGADFTPKDLSDLMALAGAIIRDRPAGASRMQILVMAIQAFISMSGFDETEIGKLKEILRTVADIPDGDFREATSLARFDNIVTGSGA